MSQNERNYRRLVRELRLRSEGKRAPPLIERVAKGLCWKCGLRPGEFDVDRQRWCSVCHGVGS